MKNTKRKNKKILIISFLLVILILLLTFIISFVVYFFINKNKFPDNSNFIDNTIKEETAIELNLDNYREYFVLQEEITSYIKNDYTKTIGTTTFYLTKITQTTKFSIMQTTDNIKFNNVKLTIKISRVSNMNSWTGSDGQLIISYNGSGILVLTATYDSYVSDLSRHGLKYEVSKIEGSILINSEVL